MMKNVDNFVYNDVDAGGCLKALSALITELERVACYTHAIRCVFSACVPGACGCVCMKYYILLKHAKGPSLCDNFAAEKEN